MLTVVLFILCLAAGLSASAQTAAIEPQALPKDPRAIMAEAAPFYDFANPSMKPWHFIASYQLYDETGKQFETGTFEYWWASPDVYRTTWSRPSATRTDWHTADGRHMFVFSGEEPGYFEYALPSALLAPLPSPSEYESKNNRLERRVITLSHLKIPCVLDIEIKNQGEFSPEPFVDAPTYCFEPEKPMLRISSSAGAMAEYNDIVIMRDKYLTRNLVFAFGGHTIMSATVKEITDLTPSDTAFVPAATAKPVPDELSVTWAPPVSGNDGVLATKAFPVYPPKAKALGQSGTVLLQARIGIDGKIRNEQVLVGVSPLLNDSALKATSQWVYKPYLVNGNPVELETLIKVMYSLGR